MRLLKIDMDLVKFPESNQMFGPPEGMTEDHVRQAWAFVGVVQGGPFDGCQLVVTAWRPTPDDLSRLSKDGLLYFTCLGGLPPHFLSTDFAEATRVG